jgi:hypothetical protein
MLPNDLSLFGTYGIDVNGAGLNKFQSFLETINKRAPSPAKTGCGLT